MAQVGAMGVVGVAGVVGMAVDAQLHLRVQAIATN